MNLLLVGPLASGKTAIAEKLIENDENILESNYHSIEKMRREYSSGTYSGEMFAWAHFLERIEQPASKTLNIYEFSGTGRNTWNVSEAMRISMNEGEKWIVAYILADKNILVQRASAKTYDAPCPYTLDNIESSINYMNTDLKKTLNNSASWGSAPKIIVRTDLNDLETCTNKIIEALETLK